MGFEERKTAHEKEVKSTEKAGQKAKYYDVASGKSFKNLKTYENYLKSKVGHRSLVRYYKSSHSKLLSTYRSLGWTGSSGSAAVTKARDLSFMRRIQNKHSLSLGMKSNNQKH